MSKQTPLDRIRELSLHEGEEDLASVDYFIYEWHGHGDGSGYEKLIRDSYEYQGVYHPGDGCCSGNPCRYCGKVWIE